MFCTRQKEKHTRIHALLLDDDPPHVILRVIEYRMALFVCSKVKCHLTNFFQRPKKTPYPRGSLVNFRLTLKPHTFCVRAVVTHALCPFKVAKDMQIFVPSTPTLRCVSWCAVCNVGYRLPILAICMRTCALRTDAMAHSLWLVCLYLIMGSDCTQWSAK